MLSILGERATQAQVEAARAALGLDRPLVVQFAIYVRDALTGDFGKSLLTGQPVIADVARVFPATLELATIGTILGVLLGVPAGVLAATRPGTLADQAVRLVGLVGYSMPVFWLGLMGLLVFYGKLQLGRRPRPARHHLRVHRRARRPARTGSILIDSALAGAWDVFLNALSHIVLPAAVLGYYSMAYISRMTRSFMLEQLGQEYVTTARVKGMPEWRVDLGARAAQRRGAADHRHRPLLRRPPRGLGADRDRLRLAGPRALHHQRPLRRRHGRGDGRHHRRRHRLRLPQHALRRALPPARPAGARR